MAACACCRLENLMKAQPRLSPSRSLSTVTSSTVPYGSNMALTSSSLAVLESMPTNTLRSSSGSKHKYSHTHKHYPTDRTYELSIQICYYELCVNKLLMLVSHISSELYLILRQCRLASLAMADSSV